ncbi:hypothetical protein FRB90_002158 [Tulasnella sp. 427]|nr:hypothetical protein FRB90_002158 [Tulasnella sp. 427]
MTLHTALSLLAESTAAFGSVWWSEDGQLLVLTQNAIYILTPDLGIFFDPDSAVSATPTITSVEPPPKLGWYRTMLSVDKSTPNVWALDCENQAVLATGSVEVMFKAACWSPSGVSNEGLCLLAVLTSNLDISLYSPTRNHLRAAWIKIQDVTEVLKKYFKSHPLVEDSNDETVARTLSAQSQAAEAPELRVITTHLVSAQWIVRLSWSSWSNGTNGSDYCLLACALPDGSIKLLKITLVSENNEASDIAIEEADTRLVARADRRGITAMTWVNARGNESLLVYAKPGTIHVWSKTFGLRTLLLERQAVCAGSSSLVPATGIVYDKIQDTILISLSDSSVHVVYQASTNATLQPSGSIDESSQTSMSSINLTLTSRSFASIVHKLEFQRGLDAGDLAVTSGFTFFDAFGTMVWFAEMVRPQDLDYKPSAKRRSTLIVARLYDDDPTPDLLLDYAKDILNGPTAIATSYTLLDGSWSTTRRATATFTPPPKKSQHVRGDSRPPPGNTGKQTRDRRE